MLPRSAEELLLTGDVELAGKISGEAVALWRGTPYAELGDIADGARRSLGVALATAQNIGVESALAAGRHAWALQQAERLAASTTVDEHRAAILVRALDANGRRGDALAAITETRRRLRTQLGIDLGRELRGVESAILDPASDSPGERSRRGPFVGRERELDALLTAAAAGRSVLVYGEPGGGVSRLLGQVHGGLVLQGGVLVALVRCQANPGTAVSVLDDLLGELGLRYPPGLGALGGFVPTITAAARTRPLVLLVDDVQLAGPSSLAALQSAAALDRVTVVAGGHDPEWRSPATRSSSSRSTVSRPARSGSSFEARTGERFPDDSGVVGWLHRLSAGNPFFVTEVLDRASGAAALQQMASSPETDQVLSAGLEGVVRERLAALRSSERRAVELCAVAGDSTAHRVLVSLAGEAGLAGAASGGLLDVLPGGGLRVRHGVVERVAYRGIPTGRRRELHHAVGSGLADTAGSAPAAIARHLLAAAEIDPGAAAAAAVRAASAASALGAHRDAADWLRRALAAAETDPLPGRARPAEDRAG